MTPPLVRTGLDIPPEDDGVHDVAGVLLHTVRFRGVGLVWPGQSPGSGSRGRGRAGGRGAGYDPDRLVRVFDRRDGLAVDLGEQAALADLGLPRAFGSSKGAGGGKAWKGAGRGRGRRTDDPSRPPEAEGKAPAPAPPPAFDWYQVLDPGTGTFYYCRLSTGDVQWDVPSERFLPASAGLPPQLLTARAAGGAAAAADRGNEAEAASSPPGEAEAACIQPDAPGTVVPPETPPAASRSAAAGRAEVTLERLHVGDHEADPARAREGAPDASGTRADPEPGAAAAAAPGHGSPAAPAASPAPAARAPSPAMTSPPGAATPGAVPSGSPSRPAAASPPLTAVSNKYWLQRYSLFSRFDEGIMLDEQGWYSATPETVARHHAELALRVRRREGEALAALDPFAGAGGNVVQLAGQFERVLAVEIDPGRAEILRNNVRVYGVADRTTVICGDTFLISPTLSAHAAFFSPPWGGPEYKQARVFDPEAAGGGLFALSKLLRLAFHNVGVRGVVCFLPRNTDLAALQAARPPDVSPLVEAERTYLNGVFKGLTVCYGDCAQDPRRSPVPDAA